MSDEIINKPIVISELNQNTTSTGKNNLKIKDQQGLTYTLWPHKTNGEESKAYQYLKTLGLEATGSTVSIGYKEEQGEYQGKTVTYRTIIGMRPAKEGVPQTTSSSCDCNSRLMALEASVGALQAKMGMDTPLPPKTVTEPPTPFDSSVSQTARPGDPNYVDPSTIPF